MVVEFCSVAYVSEFMHVFLFSLSYFLCCSKAAGGMNL